MGVVYEAIDSKSDEQVALKILLPHAAEEEEGISRFKREFRALARLRHPNIVRVFDAGIEEDTPFIAMEFVTGRDARTHLSSFPVGPVRDRETVHIFRQIFGALAHIHARKIVHRDLKPENILVTPDGRVKLMDFGVARLLRSPTSSSGLLGTFAYMAPEQVTTGEIDGRSDLYAIGVVLYEILTGGYPFPVEPPPAALHHHVNTPPEPVLRTNPAADPALAELAHRLLEKDPVDRLQSAEEAIAYLGKVAASSSGIEMNASVPGLLFAPRMAGREEDLGILTASVDDAFRGRGRVLLVEGPSGIGKSRLLEEFKHAERKRCHILVGACAQERNVPYGAMSAILDGIAGIADRAPKDVRWRILGRDVALVRTVSPRLAGLGSPASTDHLDASERKVRLHKAMVGAVGRLALVKPVVLVIEDLHWADTLTLELIWDAARTLLAPRPGGEEGETVCPVAIILTRRALAEGPDYSEALIRRLESTQALERLALEPLDLAELGQMVRTMTSIKHPVPALLEELMGFSHGLPLMIQELLQSWLQEEVLVRRHGQWLFRGQAAELETEVSDTDRGSAVELSDPELRFSSKRPARHELVLKRLRRVSESAQRLLEKLALLGRVLPSDLVRKISGLDEPTLLDVIDELVRADLLVENVAQDGVRYRFYHEGFREALIRDLPPATREALHLELARGLEREFPRRRDSLAHVLARHFRQGGRPERAVRYLTLVARTGAAHGDLDGAQKRLDEALQILDELTAGPGNVTRRVRVVSALIDILLDYGRAKEALDWADPRTAAAARDPRASSAELLLRRAAAQFALGRLDETLATLSRMPTPAPSRSLGARCLELEGKTRLARGEYTKARAVLEAARDIAAGGGLSSLAQDLEAKAGIVMLHQGDYTRSLEKLERALSAARADKAAKNTAELLGHLGMIQAARGNTTLALSCYQEALELAEARGVRSDRERWTGALGVLMADLGDPVGARERIQEALSIARETGSRQSEAVWLGELGMLAYHTGDLQEAQQQLARSLAISRELGFLRYEAWALVYLGAISLERDLELETARLRIERGLEIAEDIGNQEIRIAGLFQLGRLRRAEGEPEQARALLEQARTQAAASQNLRWKARVEREL